MASSLHISNSAVNGMANYLARRVNGGKLRIYSGEQPVNADRNITDQVLLVEFSLPDPAFKDAEGGRLRCHDIKPSKATGTGEATWYRVLSGNDTPLWDGSVGKGDCDMNISETDIFAGAEVSFEMWEHLVPK